MVLLRKHGHKLFWVLPLLIIAGCLVFIFNAKSQLETRLYLNPANSNLIEGSNFTVSINLETKQTINTVQTEINFSKDYLEVIGIYKDDSLISFWVEEPSFDNQEGAVRLQGIVPNPGFIGTGQVVVIQFKAKKAGVANLGFAESLVLANDGDGTNILESTSGANYQISKEAEDAFISGDLNRDGRINLSDLSILITKIGTKNSKYDLNGDGKVSLLDLSILVSKMVK